MRGKIEFSRAQLVWCTYISSIEILMQRVLIRDRMERSWNRNSFDSNFSRSPNSWWKEFDLFFATGRNDRSDRETLSSLRLFSSGGRKGRM